MRPIYIGTLEDGDAPVSLYQHANGEYAVWIKIGVAMLEIKEKLLPNVISSLTQIQNVIDQEKTDAKV